MEQDTPIINATLSYVPQGAFYSHPDITHSVEIPPVTQKDRTERLELAVKDLQIGQRIQTELKEQGRSVSWLARQLGMERTSLYYTFRQNSIDLELLMRISFHIGHDFLKDISQVYNFYQL